MHVLHWQNCGGSILDDLQKYDVLMYARAYRDLDEIYTYIAEQLKAPGTAAVLVNEIENAILDLEVFLERGAIRRIGAFSEGS